MAVALSRFEHVEKPNDMYEPLMREWRLPKPGRVRPAYLEVIGDIREVALQVLSESRGLSSKDLYFRLVAWGFEIPSVRNLAMALWADPERRFRHAGNTWFARSLRSSTRESERH